MIPTFHLVKPVGSKSELVSKSLVSNQVVYRIATPALHSGCPQNSYTCFAFIVDFQSDIASLFLVKNFITWLCSHTGRPRSQIQKFDQSRARPRMQTTAGMTDYHAGPCFINDRLFLDQESQSFHGARCHVFYQNMVG